jgi:GTP-binding protein Era
VSAQEPFRSGFLAMLGRPNVGKSTLCNRLVGEKVAIVSDKPQTTRRRIAAVVHRPGAQLVILDTPGIHKPRHQLGRRMVAAARQALDGVEAAALVVDASAPAPGQGDRRAAAVVATADVPRLLVANKADLVAAADRPARIAAYGELLPPELWHGIFLVSAETGEGCDALLDAALALLPPGPPYFPEGVCTDRPEQFLAAELVREQGLLHLRDEVPHALAVTTDRWDVRESGLVSIGVTLHVEHESQKPIVIGRGGAMLREIGEAARLEIERRLGSRVYLETWVKVRPGWRDRPGSLETLGFGRDG